MKLKVDMTTLTAFKQNNETFLDNETDFERTINEAIECALELLHDTIGRSDNKSVIKNLKKRLST